MPKRVLAHFAQRHEHCPIPDELVLKLRAIVGNHIPGLSTSSWSIGADQPLCLDALHGIWRCFATITCFSDQAPGWWYFIHGSTNLSVHLENWKSAEDRPDLVDGLVQDELDKGWIYKFNGNVDDARKAFTWTCNPKTGSCHYRLTSTQISRGLDSVWYQWQLQGSWTSMHAICQRCTSSIPSTQ